MDTFRSFLPSSFTTTTPNNTTDSNNNNNNNNNSNNNSNNNTYAEWERLLRGSPATPVEKEMLIKSSSPSPSSNNNNTINNNNNNNNNNNTNNGNESSWFIDYCPTLSVWLKSFEDQLSLSWHQRIIGFIMFAVAGVIMLGFSFVYVSGLLLGQSAKFAMSYALANIFLLSASCIFVGPTKQLSSMFGRDRAIISLIYLLTLLGTLYSAWRIRSFYIVIPLLIIQFTALLFYVSSYIPYGKTMMTKISTFIMGKLCGGRSSLLPI